MTKKAVPSQARPQGWLKVGNFGGCLIFLPSADTATMLVVSLMQTLPFGSTQHENGALSSPAGHEAVCSSLRLADLEAVCDGADVSCSDRASSYRKSWSMMCVPW